jgi:hypothetical protein
MTLREEFENDCNLTDDKEAPIITYLYKQEYIVWLENEVEKLRRNLHLSQC